MPKAFTYKLASVVAVAACAGAVTAGPASATLINANRCKPAGPGGLIAQTSNEWLGKPYLSIVGSCVNPGDHVEVDFYVGADSAYAQLPLWTDYVDVQATSTGTYSVPYETPSPGLVTQPATEDVRACDVGPNPYPENTGTCGYVEGVSPYLNYMSGTFSNVLSFALAN
jgi:hypothetical protein